MRAALGPTGASGIARPSHSRTVAPQVRPPPNARQQDRGRRDGAALADAPSRARSGSTRPTCCRSARCTRRRGRGSSAEPLADGGEDAGVGLVVDEEVDVGEREPGGVGGVERRLAPSARRPARNVSWPSIRISASSRSARTSSARAPSLPSTTGPMPAPPAGAHEDGPGAVAEERRGRAIVGVGERAQPLGADHEHALGAAGLDLGDGQVASAATKPVQAAPTSSAPAPTAADLAPRRAARGSG